MVLIALWFIAGCGTTGKTSRFTVRLDPATPTTAAASLRVAPATIEPDAARLYVVNVREWGRFDAEDLANIEQSLERTLATGGPAAAGSAAPALELHLRVRRYLVAASNTGGAVLACVAWMAAAPSGGIVLQEQFYATASGAYIGTIGGIKDLAHRAIVRRVATTALYLAAGPAAAMSRPTEFKGTYTVLEDAIASLPQELVSRGNPGAMASPAPEVAIPGAVAVTGVGAPPWEAARPPADFDWADYLRSIAVPQPAPR